MKSLVIRGFLSLILCLLSLALSAQVKTQMYYYNGHADEILPDAQSSFRNGEYERALDLCAWYYVFYGNSTAESLREKSEQCAGLAKEMAALYAEHNTVEAVEKAKSLLAINPDDPDAKMIIKELAEPEIIAPVENELPVADTLVMPVPIHEEDLVVDVVSEPVPTVHLEPVYEPLPSAPEVSESFQKATLRSRLVLKGGVSILDLKQLSQTFAPGAGLGLYDIGGGRIGAEVGFYLCPGLSAQSASLFGVDADMVCRISESIYPKAGIGFFSCQSMDGDKAVTNGLCAGVGLTFFVSKHLCLEGGLKYYPEVRIRGSETISTAGASYEYPSPKRVISGGISPMISIGWAF